MNNAIPTFLEHASKTPELQEKLTALQQETGDRLIEGLAQLSAQAGTPIPAKDWATAFNTLETPEVLGDSELEALSGGLRIFSLQIQQRPTFDTRPKNDLP